MSGTREIFQRYSNHERSGCSTKQAYDRQHRHPEPLPARIELPQQAADAFSSGDQHCSYCRCVHYSNSGKVLGLETG